MAGTAFLCILVKSHARWRTTAGEVWIAQLRLLFVAKVHGNQRKPALVWWYEVSLLRKLEKLVGMSLLR